MNQGRSNKFVAILEYSGQVTEDSWKILTYTKILLPETTIKELNDWVERTIRSNQFISLTITESLK